MAVLHIQLTSIPEARHSPAQTSTHIDESVTRLVLNALIRDHLRSQPISALFSYLVLPYLCYFRALATALCLKYENDTRRFPCHFRTLNLIFGSIFVTG